MAERYDLNRIDQPVGFVKKKTSSVGRIEQDGFTHVVVFKENTLDGHFEATARFHAVQVIFRISIYIYYHVLSQKL